MTSILEAKVHLDKLELKIHDFDDISEHIQRLLLQIQEKNNSKLSPLIKPLKPAQKSLPPAEKPKPLKSEIAPKSLEENSPIPVLVIACNRPTVARALGHLG